MVVIPLPIHEIIHTHKLKLIKLSEYFY